MTNNCNYLVQILPQKHVFVTDTRLYINIHNSKQLGTNFQNEYVSRLLCHIHRIFMQYEKFFLHA